MQTPPRPVLIESVSLADVHTYDRERFNSNNHWPNGERPTDYDEVLAQCHTHHWIDAFHAGNYVTITVPGHVVAWMKRASRIGNITGVFPRSFQDELEDAIERYASTLWPVSNARFVRTESVSLKHGVHGVGPYASLGHVLESLCTSREGHNPLDDGDTDTGLRLYLMPFLVQLRRELEFRVFVHNGIITAISQQQVYAVNEELARLSDNHEALDKVVHDWVRLIEAHVLCFVMPRMVLQSCCIDLAILEDNIPYFIEVNPFGKEYSSGSALFHWLRDESLLYETQAHDALCFRYVS